MIFENKNEIKEFGKIFNVFSEKFFGMFGEIKRGSMFFKNGFFSIKYSISVMSIPMFDCFVKFVLRIMFKFVILFKKFSYVFFSINEKIEEFE